MHAMERASAKQSSMLDMESHQQKAQSQQKGKSGKRRTEFQTVEHHPHPAELKAQKESRSTIEASSDPVLKEILNAKPSPLVTSSASGKSRRPRTASEFENPHSTNGVANFKGRIQVEVNRYNRHLSRHQTQVHGGRAYHRVPLTTPPGPLSWRLIAAMMMVESSPGADNARSRLNDPMQVSNIHDETIQNIQDRDITKNRGQSIDLIATREDLYNVDRIRPTPVNNGRLDYDAVPENQRIHLRLSLRIGIAWLFVKLMIRDSQENIVGWERDWFTAVGEYNGGGNPHYVQEVRTALQVISNL
ncbi:MAG: hypothetical protein AAGG51_13460 [Cyanobacteria bacterium P01_G01_bin.54]